MTKSVTNTSSKKNINLFVILSILVVGIATVAVLFVAATQPKATSTIDSYQKCADAGYPIQMSFPEVCSVPGGKSFVNQ